MQKELYQDCEIQIDNEPIIEDEYIKQIYDSIKSENNIKDYSIFDPSVMLRPQLVYYRNQFEIATQTIMRFITESIKQNIIVVGPSGAGKTALIDYAIKQGKAFAPSMCSSTYINCGSCSNSYQILKKIINIRKKISMEDGFKLLHQKLKKAPRSKRRILIFDDLSPMLEDELFFKLTREEYFNHTMIIMVTKTHEFYNQLSDNVKSSLMKKTICFDQYKREEILTILKKRAEVGLKTYSEEILESISILTKDQFNGDIRVAISAMFEIFKDETYKTYVYDDIFELMQLEDVKLKNSIIMDYNQEYLELLYLLTEQECKITLSNHVHRAYSKLQGGNVAKSSFYKKIEDFEKKDLISKKKKRIGKVYLYEFENKLHPRSIKFVKQLYSQNGVKINGTEKDE